MTAKFILFISICSLAWIAFRLMDAESRIEAGVLNEMALSGDRDFLMQLPGLMRTAGSKEQLLILLKEKYPNVAVKDLGEDICWGWLRLKFVSANELQEITEGCN